VSNHYKYIASPIGLVEICADEEALKSLEFVDHPRQKGASNPIADEAAVQIGDYFKGLRNDFDLPLALKGTDFQLAVWHQLMQIPYGCTVSYRDIAQGVGRPRAVRAVGAANGHNPIAIIVPCHRVIGANGRLTGYASGLWRKAWLLQHEGVKDIHPEPR
jgi:methylated-DNA-[protein]-cysteine S-methyltransferase